MYRLGITGLTVKSYFEESVARKKNASCSKFRGTIQLPHLDNNKTSYYFLCSLCGVIMRMLNFFNFAMLRLLPITGKSASYLLQRLASLVGKYTEVYMII